MTAVQLLARSGLASASNPLRFHAIGVLKEGQHTFTRLALDDDGVEKEAKSVHPLTSPTV